MAILVRLLVHRLMPLANRRHRPLLLSHKIIQKAIAFIYFRFNLNWNFSLRANNLLIGRQHLYGIKEFRWTGSLLVSILRYLSHAKVQEFLLVRIRVIWVLRRKGFKGDHGLLGVVGFTITFILMINGVWLLLFLFFIIISCVFTASSYVAI